MNTREKIHVCKEYWGHKSFRLIRDEFHQFFPGRPVPCLASLQKTVSNFNNFGDVNGGCRRCKSRQRAEARAAVPDVENPRKIAVLECLAEDRHQSLTDLSRETGVAVTTVHRYLKQEKYKSFKVQDHQFLQPGDPFLRMQFCEEIVLRNLHDANFIRNICFTDECSFGLDGKSNKQNDRVWALQNPHEVVQNRNQRRATLNVWVGILAHHIIGPFLLKIL